MIYILKLLPRNTQTRTGTETCLRDTHNSQRTCFGPLVACPVVLREQGIRSDCLSCLHSGWWRRLLHVNSLAWSHQCKQDSLVFTLMQEGPMYQAPTERAFKVSWFKATCFWAAF